jgi:hypothetical protein
MQYSYALLALVSATSVIASPIPLNINLGAYSPALVVGDGEISFGGAAEASALVETLSGASATGDGAATGITRAEGATPSTATIITPSVSPTAAAGAGIGRNIDPREPEPVAEVEAPVAKRDLAGFTAALNYATGALKTSPEVQLGTGEGGSGVGITVKAGAASNTAAAPATKVGKRDEEVKASDVDVDEAED